MLAKTAAAGSTALLPEVLAFTSSLAQDQALVREDLVGSLAHAAMLGRTGLIPADVARALQAGLARLGRELAAGSTTLPEEEDVHMAVESWLQQQLGAPAGFLHTARSRNDQVALTLRLHAREVGTTLSLALLDWMDALLARAAAERDVLMPAYTHRQRAQPISAAYWLLGYAAMAQRDCQALAFAYAQADALPLGVGAIAGSSLPIDRELTRTLLRFDRLTVNGLDTVGDRDFALDLTYACTRALLHASRFATDVIDFSSREFGFLRLDGEIACGSSMMPQKKNPDLFELVRGKSGAAVGDLTALLVLLKGLPGGYNRDLQEDRGPFLASGVRARAVFEMLTFGLPRVTLDRARCLAALSEDATQATDLAEALVKSGMAFRTAYQHVGALVRHCQQLGIPLGAVTVAQAREVHPVFDAQVLESARVEGSVARKVTAGSTGPQALQAQLDALSAFVTQQRAELQARPRLSTLFQSLQEDAP